MSLQDLSPDGGAIGEEGGAKRGGGKEEEGAQEAYIKGAGKKIILKSLKHCTIMS